MRLITREYGMTSFIGGGGGGGSGGLLLAKTDLVSTLSMGALTF